MNPIIEQAAEEIATTFPCRRGMLKAILARHFGEAVKDKARLDTLELFLKSCADGVVAFNSDPDIECDDTPNGLMPVGFRIFSSGCHGPMMEVGETLRAAIDAARAGRDAE